MKTRHRERPSYPLMRTRPVWVTIRAALISPIISITRLVYSILSLYRSFSRDWTVIQIGRRKEISKKIESGSAINFAQGSNDERFNNTFRKFSDYFFERIESLKKEFECYNRSRSSLFSIPPFDSVWLEITSKFLSRDKVNKFRRTIIDSV